MSSRTESGEVEVVDENIVAWVSDVKASRIRYEKYLDVYVKELNGQRWVTSGVFLHRFESEHGPFSSFFRTHKQSVFRFMSSSILLTFSSFLPQRRVHRDERQRQR